MKRDFSSKLLALAVLALPVAVALASAAPPWIPGR